MNLRYQMLLFRTLLTAPFSRFAYGDVRGLFFEATVTPPFSIEAFAERFAGGIAVCRQVGKPSMELTRLTFKWLFFM